MLQKTEAEEEGVLGDNVSQDYWFKVLGEDDWICDRGRIEDQAGECGALSDNVSGGYCFIEVDVQVVLRALIAAVFVKHKCITKLSTNYIILF